MKKRLTALITLLVMTFCTIPAFAAGNNIVMSSDAQSITYTLSAQQLDGYYFDSNIKYYTFSIPSLTVRADKNNFYDRGLAFVEFSLKPNEFCVKYHYNDGSEKVLEKANFCRVFFVRKNLFPAVGIGGQGVINIEKLTFAFIVNGVGINGFSERTVRHTENLFIGFAALFHFIEHGSFRGFFDRLVSSI